MQETILSWFLALSVMDGVLELSFLYVRKRKV